MPFQKQEPGTTLADKVLQVFDEGRCTLNQVEIAAEAGCTPGYVSMIIKKEYGDRFKGKFPKGKRGGNADRPRKKPEPRQPLTPERIQEIRRELRQQSESLDSDTVAKIGKVFARVDLVDHNKGSAAQIIEVPKVSRPAPKPRPRPTFGISEKPNPQAVTYTRKDIVELREDTTTLGRFEITYYSSQPPSVVLYNHQVFAVTGELNDDQQRIYKYRRSAQARPIIVEPSAPPLP